MIFVPASHTIQNILTNYSKHMSCNHFQHIRMRRAEMTTQITFQLNNEVLNMFLLKSCLERQPPTLFQCSRFCVLVCKKVHLHMLLFYFRTENWNGAVHSVNVAAESVYVFSIYIKILDPPVNGTLFQQFELILSCLDSKGN